MKILRTYLWKEWREQRAAFCALAIVLPALVLSISASLPRRFLGDATFAATVIVLTLAATLVTTGGELLSGERRDGGRWLERLPGGLPAAFRAKLLLFVGSTAVALAAGFALGLAGTLLYGLDVLARVGASFLKSEELGGVVVAGVVLACWTFAASAWCPRGMLAVCAGALLAGALGAPLWLHRWAGYEPETWELRAAIGALVVGGLAAAWVGFVRGQVRGRPWWSAAWRAGLVGLACVLPLEAWGFHQVRLRDQARFSASDVEEAWAFGDGRQVLVRTATRLPRWGCASYVFLLDLEADTWRRIGGAGASFEERRERERTSLDEPALLCVSDGDSELALDPFNAERVPMREATWTLPWSSAGRCWNWVGDPDLPPSYFDPHRGVVVPRDALDLEGWIEVFIGPDFWLVQQPPTWFEYLPDGELVRASWMDSVISGGPMLTDGRMLAFDGRQVLVDPRRREVLPLTSPPECNGLLRDAYRRGAFRPHEPLLLDSYDPWRFPDPRQFLLDPERLALEPVDASYSGYVLRALPDGTLLFFTDEGIVRRDGRTGTRTLVFSFVGAREVEALQP